MASRFAPMQLVLASASPRRKQLLSGLGISFEIFPAELDETPRRKELPKAYVRRVAEQKAEAVARHRPEALVLAADTTVVLEDHILGKPETPSQARSMLRRLSGRSHVVLSAIALAGRFRASQVVSTTVYFRPLAAKEIAWYVATGEPMDKAGAYALQGHGGVLVRKIVGSHSNVIGLPLAETAALLEKAGLVLPWSSR